MTGLDSPKHKVVLDISGYHWKKTSQFHVSESLLSKTWSLTSYPKELYTTPSLKPISQLLIEASGRYTASPSLKISFSDLVHLVQYLTLCFTSMVNNRLSVVSYRLGEVGY